MYLHVCVCAQISVTSNTKSNYIYISKFLLFTNFNLKSQKTHCRHHTSIIFLYYIICIELKAFSVPSLFVFRIKLNKEAEGKKIRGATCYRLAVNSKIPFT